MTTLTTLLPCALGYDHLNQDAAVQLVAEATGLTGWWSDLVATSGALSQAGRAQLMSDEESAWRRRNRKPH